MHANVTSNGNYLRSIQSKELTHTGMDPEGGWEAIAPQTAMFPIVINSIKKLFI